MKGDEAMENNRVKYIGNLPEYENLIKDLINEHKTVYGSFREKNTEFKDLLLEDFKNIMAQKGYKIDYIYNKLRAVNTKFTVELYEHNGKTCLNFKSENSSINIKEDGKVDFKNDTISKLFILYLGNDLETQMFNFGGWSHYDKLSCSNKEYEYTVEYYHKEYLKLKEILDEQKKLLKEANLNIFFINLKLFVNEGALVFSSGHEKQIGKFRSMKEVLDKAFELV